MRFDSSATSHTNASQSQHRRTLCRTAHAIITVCCCCRSGASRPAIIRTPSTHTCVQRARLIGCNSMNMCALCVYATVQQTQKTRSSRNSCANNCRLKCLRACIVNGFINLHNLFGHHRRRARDRGAHCTHSESEATLMRSACACVCIIETGLCHSIK